ncbi:hypothetical protein ACQB60_09465 [Actinomycetota bacterium Odt1-20B]
MEVVLGVTFPLLFVYQLTSGNEPLQATLSVLIAVSAALGQFFGWRQGSGEYRAQNILLGAVIGEWEIELIGLIVRNPADKKEQALAKTGEALRKLFEALDREHHAFFGASQTPSEILDEVNRRQTRARNQADDGTNQG